MSNTDSPLHLAVKNNNIEIAKMLLESQCDVHAVNAEGLTPLQLATQANNAEMVALLFQHGAGNQPQSSQQVPNEPPSHFPLDANQRKQRIRFWTIAHNALLAILTLVACLLGIYPENDPDGIAVILLISLIMSGVAYMLCLFYFVFRIWEEVPANLARTTPRKGAGFLFIPFYYMY